MNEQEVKAKEQEAAALLLAQLRSVIKSAKYSLRTGYSDNGGGRNGCNSIRHREYLQGGCFILKGDEDPDDRLTEDEGNRGEYYGEMVFMDAVGKVFQGEWGGSWSRWQGEGRGFHLRPWGFYSAGADYDDYDPAEDNERPMPDPNHAGDMRSFRSASQVGTEIADEEVLTVLSLDDLAEAVADAEAAAEEHRRKRYDKLTARNQRAEEIIAALRK